MALENHRNMGIYSVFVDDPCKSVEFGERIRESTWRNIERTNRRLELNPDK